MKHSCEFGQKKSVVWNLIIEVASGSGFPLLHQIAPALFKIPTFFVSNTGNALHTCIIVMLL